MRLASVFGRPIQMYAAEVVTFVILLAVSLLEIPMIVFVLRGLKSSKLNYTFVCLFDALFVSFASVYASIQAVLFGGSYFSSILLGLILVRVAAGIWIF